MLTKNWLKVSLETYLIIEYVDHFSIRYTKYDKEMKKLVYHQ